MSDGPFVGYRPITDLWILARPKVKYYGAYPNGFLERARPMLGAAPDEPILHVCGGRARDYPNKVRGFGKNDRTLDLDLALEPDYGQDALDVPTRLPHAFDSDGQCKCGTLASEANALVSWECLEPANWRAILIDLPYTDVDADEYAPGRSVLRSPKAALAAALLAVAPGRKVGVLHYLCPRPPKTGQFIAVVGVMDGFENRIRAFSVYERRRDA